MELLNIEDSLCDETISYFLLQSLWSDGMGVLQLRIGVKADLENTPEITNLIQYAYPMEYKL